MGKGKERGDLHAPARLQDSRGARQGATGRGDAERAPFSFRLLGIGFWQAWWMLVLCTSLVLPSGSTLMGVRASAWTLLFTSAGFVVAALLSFRQGPFVERANMFPVAGALCGGGTALCLLLRAVAPGDALSALFLAALLIAAFGNAFLLVMWGELWATLATDRVSQYLLSSYAFAFVLFFGVQALPSAAAAAIVCLLPVVSCAILHASRSETRRGPTTAEFAVDRPLVAKAVVAVVAAGLAYGVAESFYANAVAPNVTVSRGDFWVAGAGFIALAIYIGIERPAASPIAIFRPIVPALSVGLILFAVLPPAQAYLGNGLVILGGYCVDIAIMLVSADLAFRAKRSVALSFSCSILVLRLATIAGLGFVDVMVQAGVLGPDDQTWLLATFAILVIVAGTLVFSQSDLQRFYQPQPTVPRSQDLEERCAVVAAQCGITARETEVLVLLASGRNVPYLCKELCIAESTARHHVGSIYRKLGVFDRQGMLDVILQE